MMVFLFKVLISASVIAFASWLSGKRPELAGFIIALPLATLLVLPFSYTQYQDPQASIKFAQSIFTAVPLSLLFFIPFLLASKLGWGFWALYASGLVLLICGYFIHRAIMGIV
jgi:hypothetical protein